jgi:hypothetical protein
MLNTQTFLTVYLSALVAQAPQLLFCIVALVVSAEKLRHASAARNWALSGFGLAVALALLLPLAQAALQARFVSGEFPPKLVGLIFAGFGMFASLLHAVVLGLLLAAIVSERGAQPTE